MTFIELFSGAGGAHLGILAAGGKCLAAVEKDKTAYQTLRANKVQAAICADVSSIDYKQFSHQVNLLWASPPCQPYSTAGHMKGSSDARCSWSMTLEAVKQCAPHWVIVENVRHCPAEQWSDDLRSAGYAHVTHRQLNCADYGLPQKRIRSFIVAGQQPYQWPMQTHCSSEAGLLIAAGLHPWQSMVQALDLQGVTCQHPAPTITTAESQGLGSQRVRRWLYRHIGLKRFTLQQCQTLQGFPDDYVLIGSSNKRYHQLGNAVPPVMANLLVKALI